MAHTQTATSKRSATRRPNKSRAIDALKLLKRDHQEVDELIEAFAEAEEPEERAALAQRICNLLTVHTLCEEEHLYPAALEHFVDDEQDVDLVHEAQVEHETAKDLITRIENMDAEDEKFAATVTVLGEYVRHHVKEEEEELFPKLRRSGLDLEEIGRAIAAQKRALAAQFGLKAEDE